MFFVLFVMFSCFVCFRMFVCTHQLNGPLIGAVASVRGFEPSEAEGACRGSNHRLDEC